MIQPQSDEAIRPIVDELKRLDSLVDVRWNPTAVLVKRGDYTVLGKRTDAEYDGRWQVIRYDTPGIHDRNYVVLVTVTQPVRIGKRQILMMQSKGPYAPIEHWLIEYMQTWDAAQRRFAENMASMWADHDQAEIAAVDAHVRDRAAHQEAAEKVYREGGGGEYWMGGAQGKAHPATVATLFGKGKKTAAPSAAVTSATP